MRDEEATRLYQLGRDAFEQGRIAEAVDLFRASASLSPHFKTLELLGESLVRLDRTAEGAIYLAAAAGFAPKQARPRFLLAEVLVRRGATRDARAQLLEALRINPRYRSASELLNGLPAVDDDE
jgi:tetratricopeptide (TPR) repeat protein